MRAMYRMSCILGLVGTIVGSLVAATSGAAPAEADEYPSRPITVVVPYPAGGTTDVQVRRIQSRMQEAWGQPVIIENRSGSAGNIGSRAVAKAKPDGYTLLANSGPTMAISRSLYADLPYDPIEDLAPVAVTAFGAEVIVARNDLPADNVKELVALAKKNPGKYIYGSPGIGTVGHMTGEMLKSRTGIDLVHVPYKGSAPGVLALLKGEVDIYFDNLNSSLPYLREGKYKAVGNAGLERHPLIPDVPTVAESGYPGFSATPWFGIWAPAGTPRAIVDKLNEEVVRIQTSPEVKKTLDALGQWPETWGPDELEAFMRQEVKKWGEAVEASGVEKVK